MHIELPELNLFCNGPANRRFCRFLGNLIATYLLSPRLLPPLLRSLRSSLFPGDTLAPPRIVPTPAKQRAIKRECAETLLDVIPPVVARRFFALQITESGDSTATEKEKEREQMLLEIEDVLDIFGDAYMNKHLVFGIVELCLVRLLPEIGDKGVKELMQERLGDGWE